jgi:hypothetical protein
MADRHRAYREEQPLADLIPPDRRRRNMAVLAIVSAVAGGTVLALGQQLWSYRREAYMPTAPIAPRPPAVTAFTQSFLTSPLDRTSRRDGTVKSDGSLDQGFDVTIDGPCTALVLLETDVFGVPSGGQQWDTLVGQQPIPSAANGGFQSGSATWQLAVYEGDAATPLNKEDGSLVPLGSGKHVLHVYASDSGVFHSGSYFRIYGVAPDGRVFASGPSPYSGDGPNPPPPIREPGAATATFNRGAAAAALGAVDLHRCRRARRVTSRSRSRRAGRSRPPSSTHPPRSPEHRRPRASRRSFARLRCPRSPVDR